MWMTSNEPALVLAPMEGVTDAPMRALVGSWGAFTYAVSEFLRVSQTVLTGNVIRRHVPELLNQSRTPTGLPVQVQLLGGHAERVALSATAAVNAGATAIDLNFGCPAKTVNRNDGGATLLQYPLRIREIVKAVREAVPRQYPVSAKLRLGWDDVNAIHENARMAVEGGASWLTIHARTREQGYAPPVDWPLVGAVRKSVPVPVIANGDIWSQADFKRCREETGCIHFMLGRGALANPALPRLVAVELGLNPPPVPESDWASRLLNLINWSTYHHGEGESVSRIKQWLALAARHGTFTRFDQIKRLRTATEILLVLKS